MFLIVGLGNPGQEYQNTWHNLGFLALDGFAKKNNLSDFQSEKELKSLVSTGLFESQKIILAKPQTFMNESGQAIKRLLERYQIETPGLVVIHDDADLPKGEIRLSQNRGTAGHKGLESIVKALGTKDFARIRLGVRPKNYVPGSKLLARFVLKKISAREKEVVRETIQKASQALEKILRE